MSPDLAGTPAMELHAFGARGMAWLRDLAWPLWLDRGVDWPRGAFHDALDPDTLACPAPFRRLRVAARQTYVFAEASGRGIARAEAAVELGITFLRRVARQSDGGFAWRFDLDNAAVDVTRDLYDHAFVLLAFASAAPVLAQDRTRREALDLLAYVDAHFAHPLGGYRESLPASAPRRQNPHMHLLEALLAAFEAFGEEIFLDRAEALVALFAERLFQRRDGALAEFFDDGLVPLRERGRFRAEPGHHAEWIWLLDRYRVALARAGRPRGPPALEGLDAALFAFMDRLGREPGRDLLVDGVWSDGIQESGSSRLWPQLERLKADMRRPSGAAPAAVRAFANAFAYLDDTRPGLWRERRAADGAFAQEPVPASSLYHITGAFLDAHDRLGAGTPGGTARDDGSPHTR